MENNVWVITLREDINTGSGLTRILQVNDFREPLHGEMAEFTLLDGRRGWVHIKNVSGVHPVKAKA
jgi:hypothetical protein